MQFAKRSSRASNTIAPCLIPGRQVSSPPHSNRGAPGSYPTPRGATPPFFTNIGFQAGTADAIRFIRVPAPPPLPPLLFSPRLRIHIYADWIRKLSQFNMYCENRKLYGNTRILVTRPFRFFAVYSSPPSRRIAITAAITGAFGSRDHRFIEFQSAFRGEPSFFSPREGRGGERLDYNLGDG